MAGLDLTSTTLNNTVGQTILALRNDFQRVVTIKAWFDSNADDSTVAADLSMDAADVTALRAGVTDLAALYAVATAAQAQPAANDFFFNAKKLIGLN